MKLDDILPQKKIIIIITGIMIFSGLLISQKAPFIIEIILLFYLGIRIKLLNRKSGKILCGFNGIKSNISKWDTFFSLGWIFIGLLKVDFFRQTLTKDSVLGAIYNVFIGMFYLWLILGKDKITDLGVVTNYNLYEWDKIEAVRLYKKDSNLLLFEVYDGDNKSIGIEKIIIRNKKKHEVIVVINKYCKNQLI